MVWRAFGNAEDYHQAVDHGDPAKKGSSPADESANGSSAEAEGSERRQARAAAIDNKIAQIDQTLEDCHDLLKQLLQAARQSSTS